MDLAGVNRDQLLGDVINLITGTNFMMFGLVALVIACIRRRATGVRVSTLWRSSLPAAFPLHFYNKSCSFL